MRRDDQKGDVAKTAKRTVKTNQHVINEQWCIRNVNGVLTVSDLDEKIAWKSYYEKLLNTEFPWDRNSLFQADIISDAPRLIGKDMAQESPNERENG